MAGKNVASREDNGFELEFGVFLCSEWQHNCLPVIFGKAQTQILPLVLFYYFIFLTVVMLYFPKLRKNIKSSSRLLWPRIISYDAFERLWTN